LFSSVSPSLVRRRTLTAGAVAFVLMGVLAGCSPAGSSGTNGQSSDGSSSEPATTVTALSVTTGSLSGGTTVTLTGTGLDSVTGVNFGGTAAPSVTVASPTELTVVTPAAVNFVAGPAEVTLQVADSADPVGSGSTFGYESLTPLDAQMAYVLKHWHERNVAEYGSLTDNDCVNFASQSLIARGWTQNAEWSHSINANGTHNYSSPWISSTAMMKYFTAHPELATALTDQQRDQVVVGDIAQFDWDNSGDRDHTGIVTRIEGSGPDRVIYFAGHSLDSDYRSVDVAITTDHPGATAYYWHLNA